MEVVGISFREIVEPGAKAPATIKHLKVKEGIRKAEKKGSMIRSLFCSLLDPDFLVYPELLKSRHQYHELMNQSRSIHKYFRHLVMRDPETQMTAFGFHNLWFLTKTEMVNIFESVGQSMAHRLSVFDAAAAAKQEGESIIGSSVIHPIADPGNVKHMLRLILHNCTIACIDSTPNAVVRDRVYRDMNANKNLRIGFAFSESFHMRPGMDAAESFVTSARTTVDQKYLLLQVDKDGILADDYDYFLVFARTQDYASNRRPEYLLQQNVPWHGIVGVLVPANQVNVTQTYTESGIPYMRIRADDLLLSIEDHQVLDPEVDGVQAHNYKGLIKLSLAALMVGQMKATLSDVNQFLVQEKALLLSTDAIARATSQMVTDLYTAESCLYYATAMLDQLDQGLYPETHLEATLTSIITHTAVDSFYANVREILGLGGGKLGPILDLNHLLRDLMESEDAGRVKVVMDGSDLLMETRGKWVGRFAVSSRIRERSLLELEAGVMSKARRHMILRSSEDFRPHWDLQGFLHPTFELEANLLEKMVKAVGYCAEVAISAHKGQINNERLHDSWLISEVTLQTFQLLCTLARASRAYSETLRNADMDVEMVKIMADAIEGRLAEMIDDVERAVPGKSTHHLSATIAEFRRTGRSWFVNDVLDSLTTDMRVHDPLKFDKKLLDPHRDLTPGSSDKYL